MASAESRESRRAIDAHEHGLKNAVVLCEILEARYEAVDVAIPRDLRKAP